jgi:hypothetical protein
VLTKYIKYVNFDVRKKDNGDWINAAFNSYFGYRLSVLVATSGRENKQNIELCFN